MNQEGENNEESAISPDRLVAIEYVATMLCTTPQSIRTRIQYAPERFPPIVRIPGCRRLLWRLGTVIDWIREHERGPSESPSVSRRAARGFDSTLLYKGSLAGPASRIQKRRE
jgi:hypothetical protein